LAVGSMSKGSDVGNTLCDRAGQSAEEGELLTRQ